MSDSTSLVSVLIPVYNASAYLKQCLDSVVNQTYSHLQIVLIDDGSTDKSWVIMQDYALKDNRIEIYHQENAGVAITRNHLLEKIKGEYFLFIDSDDWVELEMVDFLLQRLLLNKSDIAVCSVVKDDDITNLTFSEGLWYQEKVVEEFLKHISFNGSLCNKLIKTSLLNENRFDSRIMYGEDALFCWKIIQKLSCAIITNKQLYHYRRNLQSISRQKWTPEKKGSGHLVWQEIVKDVSITWPQYLDVATARFAIEDFWGIYFAALSNYPYDEHIKLRQSSISDNFLTIVNSRLLTFDKLIVAFILSKWYKFGKILELYKGTF